MLGLAKTGSTGNPLLLDVLQARMINAACGGAVVSPWDVGALDPDLIDTCEALAVDYPKVKGGLKKVDDIFAAWRRAHPTYRK